MQTAALGATPLKVGATLPRYTGPLGRFLARQAEVKASAAILASMRANVLDLVEDPALFSEAERTATAASVAHCNCLVQLQRWFRNVHRVLNERRNSLCFGFAFGTYSHIPVQA